MRHLILIIDQYSINNNWPEYNNKSQVLTCNNLDVYVIKITSFNSIVKIKGNSKKVSISVCDEICKSEQAFSFNKKDEVIILIDHPGKKHTDNKELYVQKVCLNDKDITNCLGDTTLKKGYSPKGINNFKICQLRQSLGEIISYIKERKCIELNKQI